MKRATKASGETSSGFAKFDSLADSVRDLVLYLTYSNYPTSFASSSSLVKTMKEKGYFTDSFENYAKGVAAAADRAGFSFPRGFTGTGASGEW